MKSKRLWTLAAAATVLLTLTLAAQGWEPDEYNPNLEMYSHQSAYPFNGLAHFTVVIPPEYVGGHADMTVEVMETGEVHPVMPFELMAPIFDLEAPVVGLPGQHLSYSFTAVDEFGAPLGKRRPLDTKIVEPEWE